MRHTGIIQGAAYEPDVVCGAAASSRLSYHKAHVVQVVLSALQGRNHLPRNKDGRIAGIVVHVFETDLHRLRIHGIENHEVETRILERFLQKPEVDGTHLRSKDCVLCLHLLGENLPVVCGTLYFHASSVSLVGLDCGNQRPDANSDCSKIASLVDFDESEHPALCLEDFVHLVRCNGIKSASEGSKLHKLKIRHFGNEGGGSVQPVVVHPLVYYAQRPLDCTQLSDRILREYGKPESVNHFRNTMIDFRVKVVRTACKHNSVCTAADYLLNRLLSGSLNVTLEFLLLFPGLVNRILYLFLCESLEMRQKFLRKSFGKTDLVVDGKEGVHKEKISVLTHTVHIVSKHFRIRSHDRTVVVVSGSRILLFFIRGTGIENETASPGQKTLKMTVAYFSGITH